MNWTAEDLKSYTYRRLKDEEPRRLEMQAKAQRRAAQEAAAKKVDGSGNRHNAQVVLAFFRHYGLVEPRTEWQFDPDRKWRWDYCWNALEETGMLALEVQGGLWTGGAHVRPARMIQEFEKWNRGATLGWRILFVTPDQLLRLDTVNLIKEALGIATSVR